MMPRKHYTIADSKYADELIKLDFPENLITSAEDCEVYHNHCNKYTMKFLNGSYGSLVHQKFDKYFKVCAIDDELFEIQQKLSCKDGLGTNYHVEGVYLPLDHLNLLQSKHYKDVYILTSSPYGSLDKNILKTLNQYPYDSYIINPNFLDYHGFIGRVSEIRPPLWDVNYAFTNGNPEDIIEINHKIYDDIKVFLAFDYLL